MKTQFICFFFNTRTANGSNLPAAVFPIVCNFVSLKYQSPPVCDLKVLKVCYVAPSIVKNCQHKAKFKKNIIPIRASG